MLVVLLGGACYATAGLALGYKGGRKELKKMHPHYRAWGKVHGLVVDGT